jgi:hypothetical protein
LERNALGKVTKERNSKASSEDKPEEHSKTHTFLQTGLMRKLALEEVSSSSRELTDAAVFQTRKKLAFLQNRICLVPFYQLQSKANRGWQLVRIVSKHRLSVCF